LFADLLGESVGLGGVMFCQRLFLDFHFLINGTVCGLLIMLFTTTLRSIPVGNKVVHWLNEIRYLGVTIWSAKKITVNLQRTNQRYVLAPNAIFGHIALNSSEVVAYCVPKLLPLCTNLYLIYLIYLELWHAQSISTIN